MHELLLERGVRTLGDLYALRSIAPPGIHYLETGEPCLPERWRRISVVTADVTTGTTIFLCGVRGLPAYFYITSIGQSRRHCVKN